MAHNAFIVDVVSIDYSTQELEEQSKERSGKIVQSFVDHAESLPPLPNPVSPPSTPLPVRSNSTAHTTTATQLSVLIRYSI